MIIDASVVIDASVDSGPRGRAARAALAKVPPTEALRAPGHLAIEVMSGLAAVAGRPSHPLAAAAIDQALATAAALGISIEATPWADVHRAWELSHGSLRYPDALYVAAAERLGDVLMTADARIARSGAPIRCDVRTVTIT